MAVSVAAFHAMDLEGLVDLLKLSGRQILRQSLGRPPLDEPADLLVWNVGCVDHDSLAWLGMLSANRPSLRIVLLESFPRGDSTASALRAGASAVLGVPISLESLTGTLQRLAIA
jgi:DNA-binding NarL/FixJ family response regulator